MFSDTCTTEIANLILNRNNLIYLSLNRKYPHRNQNYCKTLLSLFITGNGENRTLKKSNKYFSIKTKFLFSYSIIPATVAQIISLGLSPIDTVRKKKKCYYYL